MAQNINLFTYLLTYLLRITLTLSLLAYHCRKWKSMTHIYVTSHGSDRVKYLSSWIYIKYLYIHLGGLISL